MPRELLAARRAQDAGEVPLVRSAGYAKETQRSHPEAELHVLRSEHEAVYKETIGGVSFLTKGYGTPLNHAEEPALAPRAARGGTAEQKAIGASSHELELERPSLSDTTKALLKRAEPPERGTKRLVASLVCQL